MSIEDDFIKAAFNKESLDHKKEGLINKEQLVAEVVQLVDRFISLETEDTENNVAFYAAVRSETFKSALAETATTNPETLLQLRTKLDKFLKQRENIATTEEMLSQIPREKRIAPENFDFKAARLRLLEHREVLSSAENIGSFFRHPVVSYFTNLLVPPEARKKVSQFYQETVGRIRGRMEKAEEEGEYPLVMALLPLIKGINEERRNEIKKEFFGAKWMRDSLIDGADEMIEKHTDEHGEEDARAIFGDAAFGDGEPDVANLPNQADERPSFEEVNAQVTERAKHWLQEGLRVTFEYRHTLDKKKTDQAILYEVRRVLGEAISPEDTGGQGLGVRIVKAEALDYLDKLIGDGKLPNPTKVLILEAAYQIANDKNYFVWNHK